MAPPEKKLKTSDDKEEAKDVEMKATEEPPKAPEPAKELEEDAKPDKNPKIKDAVTFLTQDTTMNVVTASVGNLLMPLTDGGLHHLLAGARANVGVKSGRYMFEAKIIENMYFAENSPGPKTIFRLGFSTAEASPLMSGAGSISFDTGGAIFCESKKVGSAKKFGKDTMVAVVLNLEEGHANSGTVSLFIDGVRACQPVALPDSLKGKALFPTLAFKNCTVHYNFGPSTVAPLPFKCKTISDASTKEAHVAKAEAPKDGKYEVLMPIALPDEGGFDWLDAFLAKNPKYTELSDRAIIAWGEQSGLSRTKNAGAGDSMDKPTAGFGISSLDSYSVKDVLYQVAMLQPRNLVIMEVKGSLVKEMRTTLAAKLAGNPSFKIVANVIVGEPTADFKKKTQAKMLETKQEAADKEYKIKKVEEKRQWHLAKKKKEMEKEAKKKADEARKKAEVAKKAREAAAKKKAKEFEKAKKIAAAKAKAKAEGKEWKPEDEVEEIEEDEKEPEKVEEEEAPAEEEEVEVEPIWDLEPPKVTLTPEEKGIFFYKHATPDLTSWVLSTTFTKFSLPEKDEPFDEITYEWTKPGPACAKLVKEWIMNRKQSVRIEDLKPGDWFAQTNKKWSSAYSQWQTAANSYKAMVAKKIAEKAEKARQKAKAKALAEQKKKLEEAKKLAEAKKKAEEKKDEKDEKVEEEKEEKEEDKAMEVEEEEEEEPAEPTVDFDGLDVFGVQDVLDVGEKMPLFDKFGFEDWTIMTLKFELSTLVHAFRMDVDDPERTGIHVDNLEFYYQKYFKKALSPKIYGADSVKDLVGLVNDAVYIAKGDVVASMLPADMESYGVYVKITEAARRHRGLLVSMGEESARLNISKGGGQKRDWQGEKKEKGGDKGNKGGGKGGYGKGGGGKYSWWQS